MKDAKKYELNVLQTDFREETLETSLVKRLSSIFSIYDVL